MEKFTVLTAIAAPLLVPNIDTDQLIRVERLAGQPRGMLAKYLLESMRYRADGSEIAEFVLHREPFRRAKILVAGVNFGCGSSRENAVWALAEWGFRAVIAPSYGDIFASNCFQNGVLPVQLPADTVHALGADIATNPDRATITIDLMREQVITASGETIAFKVDPLRRKMLLEGLDEIGLTLQHETEIAAFQKRDSVKRPWLYARIT